MVVVLCKSRFNLWLLVVLRTCFCVAREGVTVVDIGYDLRPEFEI